MIHINLDDRKKKDGARPITSRQKQLILSSTFGLELNPRRELCKAFVG